MNSRCVNTAIQKKIAPRYLSLEKGFGQVQCLLSRICLRSTFPLANSLVFGQNKVLSQSLHAAIFVCLHGVFRRGLLLLHCPLFGQRCNFFVFKITREHGILSMSPVIVVE